MSESEQPFLKLSACIGAVAILGGCASFEAHEAEQDNPTATNENIGGYVDLSALLVPLTAPTMERLTPPAADVLDRLRREFELPGATPPPEVEAQMRWYTSNEAYLLRIFERAEPYLYYIASALEARGMPSDLALLPFVESAFDPFAYSRGRAAGLWQIIPSTGRQLGLTQNWWFDARRDLHASTSAALDYLEALRARFDGDWLLAIAGYNSGGGSVTRAIAAAEKAGEATDFWNVSKYLPPETRTYVPRLIAIRNIVAEPGRYGLELPTVANSPRLALVGTGGQLDLGVAASLAQTPIDELYRLNAGLNRWATDPDGDHRLVVPADKAAIFSKALERLPAAERVRWARHKIRPGDTLIGIAAEFATTPEALRAVNGYASDIIRAGDYMMIPQTTMAWQEFSSSSASAWLRDEALERTNQTVLHTVRAGESLWSIARRYGLPVNELARQNSMKPEDVLSTGRQLIVEVGTAVVASATLRQTNVIGQTRVDYRVKRGDSLSAIAKRYRVTVEDILNWNDIGKEDLLQPGQSLVLYVNLREQSS